DGSCGIADGERVRRLASRPGRRSARRRCRPSCRRGAGLVLRRGRAGRRLDSSRARTPKTPRRPRPQHPRTRGAARRDRRARAGAGAVPAAGTPVAALLGSADGPAARSLELVVVTSRLEPGLVRRVLERALAHRTVALVYVDAPTFAGRPSTPQAPLLQLQSAG